MLKVHISNRVWWSSVAILCSLILSSSGFSQQQPPEKQAAQSPASVPVADVLRTRRLDIVDKNGQVRIWMECTDEGEAFITVVRPGTNMLAPVLQFSDTKEVDLEQVGRKETQSASTVLPKKQRWNTKLAFWNDLGKSSSFLHIENYSKSGEWSIFNFTKAAIHDDTKPQIVTEILPGRIRYQVGDKEKWLQAK